MLVFLDYLIFQMIRNWEIVEARWLYSSWQNFRLPWLPGVSIQPSHKINTKTCSAFYIFGGLAERTSKSSYALLAWWPGWQAFGLLGLLELFKNFLANSNLLHSSPFGLGAMLQLWPLLFFSAYFKILFALYLSLSSSLTNVIKYLRLGVKVFFCSWRCSILPICKKC